MDCGPSHASTALLHILMVAIMKEGFEFENPKPVSYPDGYCLVAIKGKCADNLSQERSIRTHSY